MTETFFTLYPRAPFSLSLTAWALRRRPNNEVDRWDGRVYSRIFIQDAKAVRVAVTQGGSLRDPELQVAVDADQADPKVFQAELSTVLTRMFSLRQDLGDFYSLAERDEHLRPLVKQFTGVKPPRFPTLFEALVNAVACQQVTLALGILLLNRLSQAHGPALQEGDAIRHGFPGPADLAALSPEDLRQLGFSRNKGLAIIELAREMVRGNLEVEALEKMNDEDAVHYLSRLRGVGRWSAEYVLLRGMGRINVFPGDDAGAQKSLQDYLGLVRKPDYEQLKAITSGWQPYAGLIYFHFLLRKLKARGYL